MDQMRAAGEGLGELVFVRGSRSSCRGTSTEAQFYTEKSSDWLVIVLTLLY